MIPKSYIQPIAQMCADVYNDRHAFGLAGTYELKVINRKITDTYAVAYIGSDKIYLVVRGSANWKDWVRNMQIKKKRFCGIRAHRGFVVGTQSILPQVSKLLSEYPNHKIFLSGHSRGGAIACLLGVYISTQKNRSVTVVTFGQPKVARKGVIESAIKGPIIRVQNSSDIVCRTPRNLFYGHCGQNWYLTTNDELLINPSSFIKFKDRSKHLWSRGTTHFMINYIRAWYNHSYSGN